MRKFIGKKRQFSLIELKYISGGTGLDVMFQLDQRKLTFFANELSHALSQFDYVLFDMGAGLSKDQALYASIMAVGSGVVIIKISSADKIKGS